MLICVHPSSAVLWPVNKKLNEIESDPPENSSGTDNAKVNQQTTEKEPHPEKKVLWLTQCAPPSTATLPSLPSKKEIAGEEEGCGELQKLAKA